MSDPPVSLSKKIVFFERCISIALSLVAAALVVHHMAGDSATTDEPVHIAAGVEIVRDGTGRWNPEHPPLAKALAGLALTGLDLKPAGDPIANPSHASLLLGFLYENGTPAETVLFRARLPFVALLLVLLFAVRREAGRRFGTTAGGVALAFAALDPNLIAHAGVVHTDLAVTLFVVLSLAPLARIPDRADRLAPVALGVLWGLAFLCKYSAPLLVLVTLPLMFVGRPGTRENLLRKEREPSADPSQSRRGFPDGSGAHSTARGVARVGGRLLLSTFIASLVVLFGFSLAYRGQSSSDREALARNRLLVKGHSQACTDFAIGAGRVLPPLGNIATGALSVALQNRIGAGPTYFMGRVVEGGTPWYFPVAFLVKVSLGLLAGAALGAFSPGGHRFGLLVAGALLAFLVLSAGSAYNIGVRHLLFAFPLLAILAASATPSDSRLGVRGLLLGILLLVEAIEVVAVHPHELAFFNATAGGSSGGRRFLVDSNLDWGQDLARLSAAAPAYSSSPLPAVLFGGDLPRRYPTLRPLAPGDEARPGAVIAIGETPLALGPELLASKHAIRDAERLAALRRALLTRGLRIGTIGGSIGIWRLSP
jgi:dolichyl-phosphate-mannose-protein mannosyltransferase